MRKILDAKFPSRWTGRGGLILWPPRSPDIKRLHFFRGYLKNIVKKSPIHDTDKIKCPITKSAHIVDSVMLHRAYLEGQYRPDVLYTLKS